MKCIGCGYELTSEDFHKPWPWLWVCGGCGLKCVDESEQGFRGYRWGGSLSEVPIGCMFLQWEKAE